MNDTVMIQPSRQPVITSALLAMGLMLSLPVLAQYKIVKPDGSVTYTDHAPSEAGSKVIQLGRNGESSQLDGSPSLPFELRSVAARYPVTIYTTADCAPCDSGRALLLQRGVPFSERRVATEEDAQALERLVGSRAVPALTVGPQPVRGYTVSDWNSYLDAAGYPRESKLPPTWRPPAPRPLVDTTASVPVRPPAAPPAAAATPIAAPASSSIRF